ncbi:MAG TPA: HD domain-containing phosphohydrolase [Bacillota bacterium]|nr:HD domain-containing phosphohydrolase [Bacillota bacterium]
MRLKHRGPFERYLDILAILGMCVLLGALANTGGGALSVLGLFGLLTAVAELGQVRLWPGHGVSLGSGIALTAGYLHGTASAGLSQALGGLVAGLAMGSPSRILLGNVAMFVISATAAAAWMHFLVERGTHAWLSVAGGSGLSLLVNSLLVTGALALGRQARFFRTWGHINLVSAPWQLLSFGLVLALVAAARAGGTAYVAGLCLLAVAANRAVLPAYARWSRVRAVRSLLRAVRAAHDRQGHCQRVFQYSAAIGSEARLSRRDQERLAYAALLHEVGVTPAIASLIAQPRRLTADELARVRETTVQGAARVASVAALQDVAEVVLHHGERLDGQGYPSGLAGDAIALPARVLAVANALDGMTSTRPHRSCLSLEQALDELEARQGTQFCPLAVTALRQCIARPSPGVKEAADQAAQAETVFDRLQRYVGDRSDDDGRTGAGDVFGLVARLLPADQGTASLHEMAQVLRTGLDLEETQDLVCRTAARVAGQAAALLLGDADSGRMEVRATHGVRWDIPDLDGRSFDARLGLLGLALQEGRPVSSANAAADRRAGRPNPFVTLGIRSLTVIPFPNRGKTAGALLLWDRRKGTLPEPVRRTLAVLGQQAALVLDNARLLQEAREQLAEVIAVRNLNDLVLSNVPTGVLAVDREGIIRVLNPEAERILGRFHLRPGDSLERLTGDFRHLAALLVHAATPGQERTVATLRVTDSRTEWLLETMGAPLLGPDGEGAGGVALFRDITERHRLEAQLLHAERLAVAGELAAGAAHEIRNPITCIRGLVQLLMVPGTPPEVTGRYLEIILGEIDRIEGITWDLLQMSRSPELAAAPVDLNALLEEICILFTAEIAIRQISVCRKLQPNLPAVHINPAQFKQVFMNILHNAMEAVGSGGRIDVSTAYLPLRRSVAVDIADDGPGVPAEIRDRLFEPFFSTRPNGTGLGLAVSDSIVRSHGGQIVLDSGPGQGTVFRVLIPVRPAPASEVKGSPS